MHLPTFEQLPFVARVVWDPIRALDLVDDRTGHPDHGKTMPAVVLGCIIAAQFAGRAFGIATIFAVLSASFGAAAWRTLVNSKGLRLRAEQADTTDTKTETTTSTTVVVAPRDTNSGIQPTSN